MTLHISLKLAVLFVVELQSTIYKHELLLGCHSALSTVHALNENSSWASEQDCVSCIGVINCFPTYLHTHTSRSYTTCLKQHCS